MDGGSVLWRQWKFDSKRGGIVFEDDLVDGGDD